MEEIERKIRYDNIVKLVESEKCPKHDLTVFVNFISHNLKVDYRTCCKEFADYLDTEIEKINPPNVY